MWRPQSPHLSLSCLKAATGFRRPSLLAGVLHLLPSENATNCWGKGTMAKVRTVDAVSAGGVVVRTINGSLQVALVGDTQRNAWYLPKGGLSAGETIEQAAMREAREETGLDVLVVRPVRAIEYWFYARGARVHKRVHYFLMEATGGDFSRRDHENDRADWFDLEKALEVMTYQNEIDVVREAAAVGRDPSGTA